MPQGRLLPGELEGINSYFKANGPLVHGREISAADCVIAPLLYQVEIACSELKVRVLLLFCALYCQDPPRLQDATAGSLCVQEVDLFATLNGIAKCALPLPAHAAACQGKLSS